MRYSDKEIFENRKKVIGYLKQPHLKKTVKRLANINTDGRCCLGHMCDALNVVYTDINGRRYYGLRKNDLVAPAELVEKIGLNGVTGPTFTGMIEIGTRYSFYSLSSLNDNSTISTQSIGKYLESVIMGGENTPWREIKV